MDGSLSDRGERDAIPVCLHHILFFSYFLVIRDAILRMREYNNMF
jgi:hypothetical protein